MDYSYSSLSGATEPSASTYPLLPVIFIYKHQIINYTIKALVDSGAENCYCLKSIGDYLRINFRRKKPIISTAANNSKLVGYSESINLLVNGKKIEAPFIFTANLDPNFPVILGQNGFFSQFKVCFNRSQNKFSVDRF